VHHLPSHRWRIFILLRVFGNFYAKSCGLKAAFGASMQIMITHILAYKLHSFDIWGLSSNIDTVQFYIYRKGNHEKD